METVGCISVDVRRIEYDIEIGVENKNTPINASIENLNDIEVSLVGKNKDVSCVTTNVNKPMNVTLGLVCSVPSGFIVLYAADGALFTIDNNYLIVQDNEE